MIRLRDILKRILIMALVVTMSLAEIPPSLVFADGLLGDNNGGDSTGTGTGGTGAAWSTWDGNGYRFYLVDSDFNQITASYDYTYNSKTSNFTETRFSNGKTLGNFPVNISLLAERCGQPGLDMKQYLPVSATDGTQGRDFIEWFQGDWSDSVGVGNSNATHQSSSESSSSSTSSSSSSNKKIPAASSTPTPDSSMISSGHTAYVVGSSAYKELDTSAEGKIIIAYARAAAKAKQSSFNQSLTVNMKKYTDSSFSDVINYTLGKYKSRITVNKNALEMLSESSYVGLVLFFLYQNADTDVEYYSYNNLIIDQIPAASGASEKSPAVAFLSNTVDEGGIDVSGYSKNGRTFETAFDAIKNGDCKLIIEPLLGVNIKGTSKHVYGTCWSITKYLTENNFSTSANLTVRWRYFVTIYADQDWTVGGTVKVKRGSENYGSTLAENMAIFNSGVGNSIAILGKRQDDYTETWDSKLSIEGPAPDDGALYRGQTLDSFNDNLDTTIIKVYVYEDETGTEHVVGDYIRENTLRKIYVEDESLDEYDYTVVDWQTSSNNPPSVTNGGTEPYEDILAKGSSTATQQGTSEDYVELDDNLEKVLYVKLLRTEPGEAEEENVPVTGDFIIHESELSAVFTEGFKDSGVVNYTIPSLNPGSVGSHSYNGRDTDGDGKDDTWSYCGGSSTIVVDDPNYVISKDIQSPNTNIIALTSSFNDAVKFGSAIDTLNCSTNQAGDTKSFNFYYVFTAYRGNASTDDRPTINDYTPFSGNASAKELFSSHNLKSALTRKGTNYTKDLSIVLFEQGDKQRHAYVSCGHNTNNDTKNTTWDNDPQTTEKIAIEVYKGKKTGVDNSVFNAAYSGKGSISANAKKIYATGVLGTNTLSFYPYIRMTTCSVNMSNGTANAKQDVSVLSEYERTIKPADFAMVSWKYNDETLKVTSNQWATDNDYTNSSQGWNTKNNVLKGGSIYGLSTGQSGQTVTVTTYQTIVEGEQRTRTYFTGDANYDNSEIEAKENHLALVDDVQESLSNTRLVQWVSTDTNENNAWESGIIVDSGSNISALHNGNSKASTEAKYYLSTNQTGNYLDVKAGDTSLTYYKFYADTSGNIHMISGSTLDSVKNIKAGVNDSNNIILTKTQGVSSLSGTAQTINNRTFVVTKLITALERNTGNDTTASWAPDGKWYNEAFDGIIVLVQTTDMKVGIFTTTTRNVVMDPNLCPKKSGKTNTADVVGHMVQYKCADTPDNQSEKYLVGTFEGTKVYMCDLDLLLVTRPFFVTNATVQNSR